MKGKWNTNAQVGKTERSENNREWKGLYYCWALMLHAKGSGYWFPLMSNKNAA